MTDFIANFEPQIRSTVFVGLFVVLALSEIFTPRAEATELKKARWFTNLAIFVIDIFVLRILFKTAAVGIALWAADSDIGLFNWLGVSGFLVGLMSFVMMDFVVWASHVASHKVPILWRIHRMHHTDTEIDVTTALRFHPVEIILSMLVKVAFIVLIGAPAIAVIIFEIVLNGGAMFNHSNLKLPVWVEKYVRLVIVTPDMHRIHHSIDHKETDSNYGFNLSVWDRWFATYTHEPASGHEDIKIGLKEYQDKRPSKLFFALKLPFSN